MELSAKLYSSLLVFVYHCFDRIVIHGYLSGLSRPEQVVYFFREILGVPVVDKEVLSRRTNDYQNWVEAYSRNHNIPIQWAEKESAKRITSYRRCTRWRGLTLTASTSSSKAWNSAAVKPLGCPASVDEHQVVCTQQGFLCSTAVDTGTPSPRCRWGMGEQPAAHPRRLAGLERQPRNSRTWVTPLHRELVQV